MNVLFSLNVVKSYFLIVTVFIELRNVMSGFAIFNPIRVAEYLYFVIENSNSIYVSTFNIVKIHFNLNISAKCT